MPTNTEICLIAFPWNGVLPEADTVILRDIDVVGVGAKRRQQIETLQKAKNVILQTHESQIPDTVRPIYDQELLSTLQWLRPVRTQSVDKLDLLLEQQKIFSKVFP